MSKLTATERQLIATRRQVYGKPSFKKYFVGNDSVALVWCIEFLAIVIGVPVAAFHPHWQISLPLVVLSLPAATGNCTDCTAV